MYVYLDLENPRGAGFSDEGVYEQGEGNGEFSLRATWEQGGRILSQLGGFQVSKGRRMGSKRNERKGEQKGKGITLQYCILIRVHNECLLCLNDTSYTCT